MKENEKVQQVNEKQFINEFTIIDENEEHKWEFKRDNLENQLKLKKKAQNRKNKDR